MTRSRRSTLKTIGVVGTGSTLAGTALATDEHESDRTVESTQDEDGTGALRVAHLSPDAPEVDVYVDDQRILAGVAYGEISPYLEIDPGTYGITLTAADDPETVVSDQRVPVGASYYTAAAMGELEADETETDADPDPGDGTDATETAADGGSEEVSADGATFDVSLFVDDGPEDVAEESASLRVVHASPNTPPVAVTDAETGAVLFDDVAFTEPSGYRPVDPGDRRLALVAADDLDSESDEDDDTDDDDTDDNESDEDDDNESDDSSGGDADDASDGGASTDPIAVVDLEVAEGSAYTAYVVGYADGTDEAADRPLDALVAVDGTASQTASETDEGRSDDAGAERGEGNGDAAEDEYGADESPNETDASA